MASASKSLKCQWLNKIKFYVLLCIICIGGLPLVAARAGDTGSIPGLGRSPGGGHGKPTLAWGIPMDRGALQAIVNGVAEESDIT